MPDTVNFLFFLFIQVCGWFYDFGFCAWSYREGLISSDEGRLIGNKYCYTVSEKAYIIHTFS